MTEPQHISAIILAAGFSSRMGDFKPLMPIGEHSALERLIRLYQYAGVMETLVVTGHRRDEIAPIANGLGAKPVFNERFHDGMMSSIKTGLANISDKSEAFFIQPVDIPLIRPRSLQELTAGLDRDTYDIAYPYFANRRGHPPLISTILREGILAWNGSGGLRAFVAGANVKSIDVPVVDEFVLLGMNEQDQYKSLIDRLPNYDIPSYTECMVLLTEKFSVSQDLIQHCQKVAEVSLAIARKLSKLDFRLNEQLLMASALLHDAAKGTPNHAEVAATVIEGYGFPRVAELVRRHMESDVSLDDPVNELDVLRLADRLVQSDSIVNIEARFAKKRDLYQADKDALQAIGIRFENVMELKKKIQNALGQPPDNVVAKHFE